MNPEEAQMTHSDLRNDGCCSRQIRFLSLFALTGAGFAHNLSAGWRKWRDTLTSSSVRIVPAGEGRVYFLLALVLLAVVPAVILPGDAPFINDDAWLLLNALSANDAGILATAGLTGTKGVRYGPLPTWIYQLILLITHDPVMIVLLHAVLLAGTIALAVYGISRVTGLWLWFSAILVASPYLWFYERLIWDNSFNLAFTTLALFSYGLFLVRRSRASLATSVAMLFATLLVHPMSIAFVVPIALHMVVFERRSLWKNAWLLVPILLLLAGLSWKYWSNVVMVSPSTGFDQKASFWDGFLFAFSGARILGATGLGYFIGEGWDAGQPVHAAVVVSAVLFVFWWAGIFLTGIKVIRAFQHRTGSILDHLSGIALAIIPAQALLDGFMHASGHPHYHNATWIADALLAWIAVDALVKWRPPIGRNAAVGAVVLLIIAVVSVNGEMLVALHAHGGTRGIHYGTTLANELQVVREMERYSPDTPVLTDVPQFEQFPHVLGVLRALAPPQEPPSVAASVLIIRYRSFDQTDAHIEIVAR
jgi:hypothetical protein